MATFVAGKRTSKDQIEGSKLLFKDPRSPEALCSSFVNNKFKIHFVCFETCNMFETSTALQKPHLKIWKLTNFF